MTSEALGEMFEGDFADMCAKKISETPLGGVFRFFKSFSLKISKVVLGFPNFGYDF